MAKSSQEIVMDNRKKLVEKIISNMEKGYIIPKERWNRQAFKPHNPVSNIAYKGGNRLNLCLVAEMKGYEDYRWMTYNQAKEKGYVVKRDEKGVQCEKWIFTKEEELLNQETNKMEKVEVRLNRPIVRYFTVFNGEQIEGIPPIENKELEKGEVLNIAEKFINSSECPIIEMQQSEAFYNPSVDKIIVPPKDTFRDQESYLGVVLHEMVHSTGHESRLDRNIQNTFGTSQYAMEELRAELGSFFIESDLGIKLEDEHFNSHTQYLESWIKVLKDDPNELFRACRDADNAARRLETNYEKYLELENAVEQELNNVELLNQAEVGLEM